MSILKWLKRVVQHTDKTAEPDPIQDESNKNTDQECPLPCEIAKTPAPQEKDISNADTSGFSQTSKSEPAQPPQCDTAVLPEDDKPCETTSVPASPDSLPDILWIVIDKDGEPPVITIDGKQHLCLFEDPHEAAKVLPIEFRRLQTMVYHYIRKPTEIVEYDPAPKNPAYTLSAAFAQPLLCQIYIKVGGCTWNPHRKKELTCFARNHNLFSVGNGVWLSDVPIMDEEAKEFFTAWSDMFLDRYADLRMLLAEPEWFKELQDIGEKWGLPKHTVNFNSMQGLKEVEYLWSKGGPLKKRPMFLVCKYGDDDYIFSDKKHFFFAHILNPVDWDPWIDKIGWRVYKKFEYVIPRHLIGNASPVPLDYLGIAFSCKVRSQRPTFARIWYMSTKEEGYHGIVHLCAAYTLVNNTPKGMESLFLCVKSNQDDPDAIEHNLISATNEEISAWLKQPENQQSIAVIARRMLKDYEEIYVNKNAMHSESDKGENQ